MIIVHAVQKLLNISRLKPVLFLSKPSEQQELHSWYAKLISTSFRGKLFVMYVHEPSLIVVLTKGKTISNTLPEFYNRLEALLKRNHFESYDSINADDIEDSYIEWLSYDSSKPNKFKKTIDYWKNKNLIK